MSEDQPSLFELWLGAATTLRRDEIAISYSYNALKLVPFMSDPNAANLRCMMCVIRGGVAPIGVKLRT